jgi:hypothetical protein
MGIHEEKKYTKKQMLSFAEMCMLELLSTKADESQYSEISAIDLRRIYQVLQCHDDTRAIYECKVCGKPFGDNPSLYEHYDETHNKGTDE